MAGHTSTDSNNTDDFFSTVDFTPQDPTPKPQHRLRALWITLGALVVVAALAAAIIIPLANAQHKRDEEAHSAALADCESAQREFATLNTTYRATLANAGKLAKRRRQNDQRGSRDCAGIENRAY